MLKYPSRHLFAMSTPNDAPPPKLRRTLDASSKIALILLVVTCINPVTLFALFPGLSRPSLTKMNAAMEQIDYTLKVVPKFFGR
jgi:hypothetical protein